MFEKLKIDQHIRRITLASAIRWAGWGIVEPLESVFLFTFVHNYADAGLLRALYSLVFLLALPVVGEIADRVSARSLILFGLAIYPIIGASYVTAGLTGLVGFIIVARFANGISYACDAVGRGTLIRKLTRHRDLGEVIGYFDTLAKGSWVFAALIGAVLVITVPLTWLFVAIIPTSIIAFLIVRKITPDTPLVLVDTSRSTSLIIFEAYRDFAKAVGAWRWPMWQTAISTTTAGALSVIGSFAIPLVAYSGGSSLSAVMLMGALAASPALFAEKLGWLVDQNPRRARVIALLSATLLIASLALTGNYYWQLVVSFGIGMAGELVNIANATIATGLAKRIAYGIVTSESELLYSIGEVLAPISIGALMDATGTQVTFAWIAGALLMVSLLFIHHKHAVKA